MRKILLLLFTLVILSYSYSQDIEVRLSVVYKDSDNYLKTNHNIDSVCFLRISYTNNSDKMLFLPKLYYNINNLPGCGFSKFKCDVATIKRYSDITSKSRYNVIVGGKLLFSNFTWEVLPDTVSYFEEHEEDVVNNILSLVYKYLCTNLGFNYCDSYSNSVFRDIALNKESIMADSKELFVFLKPNTSCFDEVNLAGFQLLGGSYQFMFAVDTISNIVTGSLCLDSITNKISHKKYLLPSQVGNYNIYTGQIKTNTITINF